MFAQLPLAEQLLAILALVLIGLSSATIALLPFRRFAGLLGRSQGPVGYLPLLDARETRRAVLVRRAVGRGATVAPFRSNCLPQAMAAAMLSRLLRFPLATHLGVEIKPGGLAAHAWSTAGSVMVSGGFGFGRYTVVSCFVTGVPWDRARRAETGPI